MNNKANIRHWHSTHKDWLRALNFYKEEIGILNDRLTEIAGKNTGKETSRQVEHFQNQFILHRNNIEELEHAIHRNLSKIADEIPLQAGFVSETLLAQLGKERQVFLEEEREINELRHAFNLFSAAWM
jgi:hypothetical protein